MSGALCDQVVGYVRLCLTKAEVACALLHQVRDGRALFGQGVCFADVALGSVR